MPAIVRLRVPGAILWLVLCVPGSSYVTVTIDASTRDVSITIVTSAPQAPAQQLVRVKADKTAHFSGGALAAPPYTALHRPAETTLLETTLAPDPPSVVLSCPPLAPRPPPTV